MDSYYSFEFIFAVFLCQNYCFFAAFPFGVNSYFDLPENQYLCEFSNDSNMKRIAVFCSGSSDIKREFNAAARQFVTRAAGKGYGIVSGGTTKGTMGEICDALEICGGSHRGVLPRFMEGLTHKGLSEVIYTDTMSERKQMMRKDTFAAVALPGGIGTMDELFETYTLRKLHQYEGDIYALNIDGFYDPLVELLDYFVRTNMLDEASRSLIRFPKTVDELMNML